MIHAWVAGLALLGGLLPAAHGQAPGPSAWRCPDGRYTDAPCPGGTPLNVADPRDAEQQRQAREAARRERALADKLTAERRAEEAAAARRPAPMAGIGAKPPPPAASAPKKAKKPKRDKRQQDEAAPRAAGKKAKPPPDATSGRLGKV